MRHEGLEANDGVVAPVMRFAKLPEVQAGGEEFAIDAGGELLHARIKGVSARSAGRGLDNAGAGVGFHESDKRTQALAGHHAVCVEHHHVAVVSAPATAEVVDIAALALDAAAAVPIVDAAVRILAQGFAQQLGQARFVLHHQDGARAFGGRGSVPGHGTIRELLGSSTIAAHYDLGRSACQPGCRPLRRR